MEQHLLLLNGPPGVGKTALARHLAALRPRTVCIAGDRLREFAPADAAAARALLGAGSTYRAGAALAAAYFAMGAQRVIFEYVFEEPAQLEHFRRAAPTNVPLYVVTLWAALAEVQAREAARPGHAMLGPAVESCFTAMESHLDQLGRVILTDGRTVEEVAAEVDALTAVPSAAHLTPLD